MFRTGRRSFTRSLLGSLGAASLLRAEAGPQAARRPSLTDVDGLLVGHYTYTKRPTGCTVITSETPFAAGVDVRGPAPGTRETDLLRAEKTVDRVHAILLAGGSAFGLDAAGGVMRYLEEQGRGIDVEVAKVPIVPAAILFDLRVGDAKIRPDAAAGYEAARAASRAPVQEGNVGAGAGATVGKMLGTSRAMKAGLGSWSLERSDGLKVGALVAVNCVGDVVDPARGVIVAGARKDDGSGFLDIAAQLRRGYQPGAPFHENTVLGVVATNAALGKAECNTVAQLAQAALGRAIRPAHTPWDGDTVFAIATGTWSSKVSSPVAGVIGVLAADVLTTAILRGVDAAESYGPYPAARDYPRK